MLRLLIKVGADPKATNVELESPASLAYSSGHTAAADWLEAVVAWKKDGEGSLTSDLPPHPLLEAEGDPSNAKYVCVMMEACVMS